MIESNLERAPSKWYSRKHMDVVGIALFATGIWVAIVFLPAIPVLSISLFALIAVIGGVLVSYKHGVLINYKKKKARWVLFLVSCMMSWGYGFYMLLRGSATPGLGASFYVDFGTKMFPVVALVTLPFAWWGRLKISWDTKFPVVTWLLCLLVVLPFVSSCIWDYNVKADTSLPQVITVTIVSAHYDDELGYSMHIQALKGKYERAEAWIWVSESFYREHDRGSSIEIRVHEGALGYPWVEGYVD